MKKLLIVVMACYGLTARAQLRPSGNFIHLYSDSVIYADKIRLRPDFTGTLQLRADAKRFPMSQVKFFNNEDGFFANTRKLNRIQPAGFAERIIEGRINVFQEVDLDPFLYDRPYYFNGRRNETVNLSMYYTKGEGDLQKVKYNNLKRDMADNAESMRLLAGYRKSMTTSKILYVSAGVSIIAGLVAFIMDNKDTSTPAFAYDPKGFPNGFNHDTKIKRGGTTAAFILMGASLGLAGGGYAVHLGGVRRLENAVDSYNK